MLSSAETKSGYLPDTEEVTRDDGSLISAKSGYPRRFMTHFRISTW